MPDTNDEWGDSCSDEWDTYWQSLTPEEQTAELAAMDRYASESTEP